MRVLKWGKREKDPENIPCTCMACQCQFVFRASEARVVEDSRDGDYFRVACPACECLNSVDCRLAGSAATVSGDSNG